MAFRDEFERSGRWLFRWRSYLPFVTFALVAVAMRTHSPAIRGVWAELAWQLGCLGVSLTGLTIRMLTAGYVPSGTSGRNTTSIEKARQINTTGAYSLVRHPLYLGNFLNGLGMSLFPCVWWLALIYCLMFWLYYERIIFAEEEFLRRQFGPEFELWAATTPAMLPRFRHWRRPDMPFSWKSVLRREHHTVLLIAATYAGMAAMAWRLRPDRPALQPLWLAVLGTGMAQYAVIRTIRKCTRLLSNSR